MKKLLIAMMLALSMGVVAQEPPSDNDDDEMEAPPPSNDPTPTHASASAPKIGATPTALQVTVNLTASPITGTCPYNTNLSWTASNASVCTKTGAWSGNAGASGSESINVNAASMTFTLTCSSNTDTRNLTWTNPTQNTDGTAVSLSGNKVYHAASAANIESANPPIVLTPAKTAYLLAGLPAGPRVVGVKATGSTGIDSAMSPLASATIVLPTGADTVQAGCTVPPEPKPPTGVTIASTVWDVRRSMGTSPIAVGRDGGVSQIGAACIGDEPMLMQGETEYWDVGSRNRPEIKIYRKPRSTMLLGQCQVRQEWVDYRNWLATQG
jgi:hypothetical protein